MRVPRLASMDNRLHHYVIPEPNSGCWLWIAGTNPNGYGQIRIKGRGLRLAHCLLYEYHRGEVPEGLELDHLCRVRCCVNPWHMEPVTHLENVRRGQGHGSETHCPHGHEYNSTNTCCRSNGTRACRTCNRIRMRGAKITWQ